MRIVAFSDSHNNYYALRKIVLSRPETEIFLHLGDGENEFGRLKMEFPHLAMLGVRGNCDWGSTGKISDIIVLEGKKIFFTHGHSLGVKAGYDLLKTEAERLGADIVLFGHTHFAETFYENGIYYTNPGSVTSPRGGKPSYGVIDITAAGIVTFIAEL